MQMIAFIFREKKKERIIFNTKVSIVSNGLLAAAKLTIGIYNFSIFLCINACYNVGMAFAKMLALHYYKKEDEDVIFECYKQVGMILSGTALIYILYSTRLFFISETTSYSMLTGIMIATLTFMEIGLSIFGFFTNDKKQSPTLHVIKIISLSSSLISLVLTQAAILSFTENEAASSYNGLIALIFGSIVLCLGGYLLLHLRKKDEIIGSNF